MLCWVYNELKELGERIAQCICCLLCGGPILAAVGIAFLVSSGVDTRGDAIAKYNAAIPLWTAATGVESAAAFGTPPKTYVATVGGYMGAFVSTTSPPQSPAVEAGADIKTYTVKQAYSLTGSNPFTTAASSTAVGNGVTLTLMETANGNTKTSTIGNVQLRFNQRLSVSCSSSDSLSTCNTKCSQRGGVGSGNPATGTFRCDTYLYLAEVCLVVDPTATTTTLDAPRGCASLNSVTSSADASMTLRDSGYSSVGPFNYLTTANINSQQVAPTVTIKSKFDPYVVAVRVTNGSPNTFGLTTAQKQSIGGALLAVGIVWFVLVICGIAAVIKCYTGKRKGQGQGVVAAAPPGMPPGAVGVPMPVQPQYGNPMPMPGQYPMGMPVSPPGAGYPQQGYGAAPYPQAGGYPPQQQGYPPQQGYPQQGYPQQGYPPQQGYGAAPYPQAGYPPQGGYPQQGYPPQQQPGYGAAPYPQTATVTISYPPPGGKTV